MQGEDNSVLSGAIYPPRFADVSGLYTGKSGGIKHAPFLFILVALFPDKNYPASGRFLLAML